MAKGESVVGRQAGVQLAWPVDEDGNPLALVTNQASELIGLPNYSNVTLGPGSITKFVKNTPEERQAGVRECLEEVESILAEERERILKMLQGAE